jgi:hypothetical protein
MSDYTPDNLQREIEPGGCRFLLTGCDTEPDFERRMAIARAYLKSDRASLPRAQTTRVTVLKPIKMGTFLISL